MTYRDNTGVIITVVIYRDNTRDSGVNERNKLVVYWVVPSAVV